MAQHKCQYEGQKQSFFTSVAFLPPGLSIFSAQSFDYQTACLMRAINQGNDALNYSSTRDVRVPKEGRKS